MYKPPSAVRPAPAPGHATYRFGGQPAPRLGQLLQAKDPPPWALYTAAGDPYPVVSVDQYGNFYVYGNQVGPFAPGGLAPSGDPTGTTDTENIQGLLNTFGTAQLGPGTFLYNQPLDLLSAGQLLGQGQSFGIPIANYGVGGLPLQGTILKATSSFTGADSGTGTVLLNTDSGEQGGGQRIQGISFDWSDLPEGNDLHGIFIENNTACVTLRDITGFGGGTGDANILGGDCLHCIASGGSPPDLLDMAFCHWAGAAGFGVTMSGVADSYITASESTANGSAAWNIINCNNSRWLGAKGETTSGGPGWLLTANAGFTGVLHFTNSTSQANAQDGWKLTGAGTGTYQLNACTDDASGTSGTYAGFNVDDFAGVLLGTQLSTRVGSGAPAYGVNITGSPNAVIALDNCFFNAVTDWINGTSTNLTYRNIIRNIAGTITLIPDSA
jgi:hypothetical protein